MDERSEIKQEFEEKLKDEEKISEIEGVIRDNKVCFKVREETYRLRKASYAEKQEIDAFRRKLYLSYLKDDSMIFKKDLVKMLKEKQIDIDKNDLTIKELQNSIDNLLLILAQTTIEKEIQDLKSKILTLKTEQNKLYAEKSDVLTYCIEEQLSTNAMIYYAQLVLDKKVEENWVKAFKNYDEFIQCEDSQLIEKITYYITYLVYSD